MACGNGISNVNIEKLFENKMSDHLKKNFMGMYSSNSITRYRNFYEIIIKKKKKENKPRMHWWSFLDIYLKEDLLLFDSFGFTGFKKFIVDNDVDIINKMLFN